MGGKEAGLGGGREIDLRKIVDAGTPNFKAELEYRQALMGRVVGVVGTYNEAVRGITDLVSGEAPGSPAHGAPERALVRVQHRADHALPEVLAQSLGSGAGSAGYETRGVDQEQESALFATGIIRAISRSRTWPFSPVRVGQEVGLPEGGLRHLGLATALVQAAAGVRDMPPDSALGEAAADVRQHIVSEAERQFGLDSIGAAVMTLDLGFDAIMTVTARIENFEPPLPLYSVTVLSAPPQGS